jgi:plastocyanin
MRVRCLGIGVLVALLLPAVSAPAANQTVTATGISTFSPKTVTVNTGEMVTWNNGSGLHNVHFDDNSFDMPALPDSTPWSVSRNFDTLGVFRYYCELHGGPNGIDMSGAVYVKPAATPPPPPGGQPVSADKTAPGLTLSGSTRQKALRQRAVFVRARVDEPSRLVARAWVSVPRTGRSFRAKTVSRQLAARTTSKLGLVLSRQALRAFRRALRKHTRLTARITVTAKDPAGNRASAKRRVKLKK